MKKLEKLESQDVSIMSHREMKNVNGGYYGTLIKDKTPKEECEDKDYNEPCCWNYEGKTYCGVCIRNAFTYYKYCSNAFQGL